MCVDKIDVGVISVADVARSITIMMSSSASHLASLRKRDHGRFSISFSSVCSHCVLIRWFPCLLYGLFHLLRSSWRALS